MTKIRLLNDGGYLCGHKVKFPAEVDATKVRGGYDVTGRELLLAGFELVAPWMRLFFTNDEVEEISND